jgi:hypothetical protein
MGEDTKGQEPDSVLIRNSSDDADDTEGHRRPPNVVSDDADDTARHRRPPNVVSDDADDTEGHRRPPNRV